MASQQKRAIGILHNRREVTATLNALKESGFPMSHASVIAKQTDEDQQIQEQVGEVEMLDHVGDQDLENPAGLPTDAVNTATWSTILVGLTSLSIPGAGPVLAAGALGVSLITGIAGVGMGAAAAKNLVKALTEWGIPEAQARIYSDRLIQGKYLVMLEGSEEEMNQAQAILNQDNAQNWGVYEATPA